MKLLCPCVLVFVLLPIAFLGLVSGCGEDNQTTVVADVGFEFNGGAIATGG